MITQYIIRTVRSRKDMTSLVSSWVRESGWFREYFQMIRKVMRCEGRYQMHMLVTACGRQTDVSADNPVYALNRGDTLKLCRRMRRYLESGHEQFDSEEVSSALEEIRKIAKETDWSHESLVYCFWE